MFYPPIGNPQVTHLLSKEDLPSVLLFQGPKGVGKTAFATQLAFKLLKTTKTHPPDLRIYTPEGDLYPIETVRSLIAEVQLAPFEAPCKVFIITEAHQMQPTSSNPLLKTLEEPPKDTYLFLTSSDPEKLLPTIVSRCQKVLFFPVPQEEIAQFLVEHHQVPLDRARRAALISDGSLEQARIYALNTLHFSAEAFLKALTLTEKIALLSKVDDDIDPLFIFEEIILWVREHQPFNLEKTLRKISRIQQALTIHIKLKNALLAEFSDPAEFRA